MDPDLETWDDLKEYHKEAKELYDFGIDWIIRDIMLTSI